MYLSIFDVDYHSNRNVAVLVWFPKMVAQVALVERLSSFLFGAFGNLLGNSIRGCPHCPQCPTPECSCSLKCPDFPKVEIPSCHCEPNSLAALCVGLLCSLLLGVALGYHLKSLPAKIVTGTEPSAPQPAAESYSIATPRLP